MVPLASSGPTIIAVVIVGAVILLWALLRSEARTNPEERPPEEP